VRAPANTRRSAAKDGAWFTHGRRVKQTVAERRHSARCVVARLDVVRARAKAQRSRFPLTLRRHNKNASVLRHTRECATDESDRGAGGRAFSQIVSANDDLPSLLALRAGRRCASATPCTRARMQVRPTNREDATVWQRRWRVAARFSCAAADAFPVRETTSQCESTVVFTMVFLVVFSMVFLGGRTGCGQACKAQLSSRPHPLQRTACVASRRHPKGCAERLIERETIVVKLTQGSSGFRCR
jgi:hypothetical protein